MKQNLVTLLIIFVSTMAIRAQNIPEIRIDESSGRIDAVFNLESHTGGFDGCSEIGPFAGVIVDSGSNGPTFQKWIQIKSAKPVQTRAGKSDALVYSLPFPSVSEIIEQSLFSRGTRVTVWGWTCGSGGFLSLRDVIRTGTGTVNGQFKKPKFSESILLGDPYLAAKKAAALNNEIAELVRSASAKFDREIAPGISAGEKGEFETTEEAEARIQKIARLRKANFPKLEGKIMLTALPTD